MAQTSPEPGDRDQGETDSRDAAKSRAVAGVPTWALAIVGAGGLAVAAGFIGNWAANRDPVFVEPAAYSGSLSSSTVAGDVSETAGPDGLFATPTPVSTYAGGQILGGSQTPTGGRTSASPTRTSSTSDADVFNPATVAPLTTPIAETPSQTKTTSGQSSKPTTPVASTTTERTTPQPASSRPSSPAADEVKVAGPPSGLTVTTDDLSFGKCPTTFRTSVEVEVAYGTSASAKARWKASETGAHGSANLPMKGYNTFAGTISGIPTKTSVILTVVVTGPDGSTTNDPFEITHRC